uniref:Uncharacterized protein n=1 Tax=Anguilla anguilla TaxID=7936 RepID=A0A0E9T0W1_ANGAN
MMVTGLVVLYGNGR